MRDQTLPGRHWAGQVVAVSGAILLLLPALWFSFSDSNLLPTLFLSTPPSLFLMLLGVILVVIATALFLVRRRLKIAWTQWEKVNLNLCACGCRNCSYVWYDGVNSTIGGNNGAFTTT
jgi:hypothetical protein